MVFGVALPLFLYAFLSRVGSLCSSPGCCSSEDDERKRGGFSHLKLDLHSHTHSHAYCYHSHYCPHIPWRYCGNFESFLSTSAAAAATARQLLGIMPYSLLLMCGCDNFVWAASRQSPCSRVLKLLLQIFAPKVPLTRKRWHNRSDYWRFRMAPFSYAKQGMNTFRSPTKGATKQRATCAQFCNISFEEQNKKIRTLCWICNSFFWLDMVSCDLSIEFWDPLCVELVHMGWIWTIWSLNCIHPSKQGKRATHPTTSSTHYYIRSFLHSWMSMLRFQWYSVTLWVISSWANFNFKCAEPSSLHYSIQNQSYVLHYKKYWGQA